MSAPDLTRVIGPGWPPFLHDDRIKCKPDDAEQFYGDDDAAKALCRDCPLCDACLTWALDADERDGVWGATTSEERDRLKGRKPPVRDDKRRKKLLISNAEIAARYEARVPIRDLTEQAGCGIHALYRRLREMGIPLRKGSEK